MIEILLLFVAPVIQIVLSVLRVMGRIRVPLGVIAFLSFVLGVLLSIISMNINMNSYRPNCHDCGLVGIAIFVIGIVIALISSPVIGLIGYAVYRSKKRSDVDEGNAINN